MQQTVVAMTIRSSKLFWLLETVFLRISNFFQVSCEGHLRQTFTNKSVHPAQPSWLLETLVLRVSIFFLCVHRQTSTTEHRNIDSLSSTTIMMVRDPSTKRLQLLLSFLWRTSTTDRHYHDGSSCISIMTVKEPCPKGLHFFSKCTLKEIYDGASYPRRSVLPNRHDGQRPLS